MSYIDFYFDFSCPFAYIASTRIEALADRRGAQLRLQPVLLGGIFRELSQPDDPNLQLSPQKAQHNIRDYQRWAAFFDVPLSQPDGHPRRTVQALRLVLAAPEARWPQLMHALYRAYWVEGRDIAQREVLRDVADAEGLDGAALLERTEAQQIKDDLRARTAAAVKRGVFGVPTFFVDAADGGDGDGGASAEQLFGQDRLVFVERALGAADVTQPRPVAAAKRAPAKVLRFYHDFSSPFSYLGSTQVEALAERCDLELRWHPILLGAVFKQIGTADVPLLAMSSAKQRVYGADMQRFADLYGVPFSFPTRFPMRTVTALRLLLAAPAEGQGKLAHRIYRAFWAEDRDISDSALLVSLADEVGLDGKQLLERTGEPAIKQALFENTEQAVKAGVFGVPTFVLDEDASTLVWGQDRIALVEWMARGGA
ncbi:MAG: 2-hydroxychromene-2-carboxylate isomerase [Myxococcales bacterium]|nr:2-hydroxychromene-2-carboxylate isomerase [Myxococcales bacterium]